MQFSERGEPTVAAVIVIHVYLFHINFILFLYLFHLFHNVGKSAVRPIMVKTPDEMYESNLNVNVDMMFGYTNYVRLNFTIFKFSIYICTLYTHTNTHIYRICIDYTVLIKWFILKEVNKTLNFVYI